MEPRGQDEEVAGLIREWVRSLIEKDLETAAALREEGYSARLPGGGVLSREQEIDLIASPDITIESVSAGDLSMERHGDEATVAVDLHIRGLAGGDRIDDGYRLMIAARKSGGQWRARHAVLGDAGSVASAPAERPPERRRRLGRLIPQALRSRLKNRLQQMAPPPPTFPEIAYLPYKRGADYVLPPFEPEREGASASDLPMPPAELWLGYNYPVDGKFHVDRMLEIAAESGFAFEPGDRILDLGCGAGRMIRHLQPLAATCEIWGADISAKHIFWCKHHLSPPFHFVTTTKVPHLPFEDGSFNLVYCGSLFTHIDDLADAWLLEIHRILAARGRAYLTIHDGHTIEMFEHSFYGRTAIVRGMRASPIYQEARERLGMFTVGRDHLAQVFYHRDYFTKMLSPMFDLLSVTPEAYYYQTAYLVRRKSG